MIGMSTRRCGLTSALPPPLTHLPQLLSTLERVPGAYVQLDAYQRQARLLLNDRVAFVYLFHC